jgi:hypothetical protein
MDKVEFIALLGVFVSALSSLSMLLLARHDRKRSMAMFASARHRHANEPHR